MTLNEICNFQVLGLGCKHRAIGSSSSFSDKITSVNGSMTALQSPYGAQVAGKDILN